MIFNIHVIPKYTLICKMKKILRAPLFYEFDAGFRKFYVEKNDPANVQYRRMDLYQSI